MLYFAAKNVIIKTAEKGGFLEGHEWLRLENLKRFQKKKALEIFIHMKHSTTMINS